jgi:hypothetical protein
LQRLIQQLEKAANRCPQQHLHLIQKQQSHTPQTPLGHIFFTTCPFTRLGIGELCFHFTASLYSFPADLSDVPWAWITNHEWADRRVTNRWPTVPVTPRNGLHWALIANSELDGACDMTDIEVTPFHFLFAIVLWCPASLNQWNPGVTGSTMSYRPTTLWFETNLPPLSLAKIFHWYWYCQIPDIQCAQWGGQPQNQIFIDVFGVCHKGQWRYVTNRKIILPCIHTIPV